MAVNMNNSNMPLKEEGLTKTIKATAPNHNRAI